MLDQEEKIVPKWGFFHGEDTPQSIFYHILSAHH